MKSRVDEILEALKPKSKHHFIVVDKEKGETIESVQCESNERDIVVYFVT